MRRRPLTAVNLLLGAASLTILGVALFGAGPGVPRAAGATTTGCVLGCQPTTLPQATTVPVVTSPPTVAPTTLHVAPTTRPYTGPTTPRTTIPATTTTATTLPSINGHIPVAPSTLPFTTRQQSSHVSPVFAALSGAGFFLALLIAGGRYFITRPKP